MTLLVLKFHCFRYSLHEICVTSASVAYEQQEFGKMRHYVVKPRPITLQPRFKRCEYN
jgi:hypothetical protein